MAISDLYRDSPTAIRCAWAFRDLIEAHVHLDYADEARDEAEAEAEAARGSRGGR